AHTEKVCGSTTNAIRKAVTFLQNHRSDVRSYYQAEYAQRGAARALLKTAHQMGKVLYGMAAQQQYVQRVLAGITLGGGDQKKDIEFLTASLHSVQRLSAIEAAVFVVIPTKNAGVDLWSLLLLLKNQEGFRRIEIIIVDSGSMDETLDISWEFA